MTQVAPETSVIILNYNGIQHLPECLKSLAEQSYSDFETIIVDNGSSDGSLIYLEKEHPAIKVIALQKNTGFAEGNNIGFAQSVGKFVVTLNNDTRVDSDWLAELTKVALQNTKVGMVGSRICNYDQPDLIDSLGILICKDGMSRGAFRNQSFSSLSLKNDFDILLPSACAALYRRTMLEKTGFFDGDFFAYCEDTDLGLRCRRVGWDAILAVKAVVFHKYSQSSGAFSSFKLYHVERNHYWAAIKNLPPRQLVMLPLQTMLRYYWQANCVLAGGGNGKEFRAHGKKVDLIKALCKGMLDALSGTRASLAKRKATMQNSRLTNNQMSELLKEYSLSYKELFDNAG